MTFSWPLRVYYEDTDVGGIVYHANHLKFMERARTEWLRSLGFSQEQLRTEDTLFVVRSLNIQYKAPAFLDDELFATVVIEQQRKVGWMIQQTIERKNNHTQEVLAVAQVEVTCVSSAGKPKKLPQPLLNILEQQ
ncbi:MAG TPA: tol-pal system-associated acyl-CoA thioesterase [Pseudomonadales bacterium]|nr:tol-pal system-associated acyl-CoA thioesterase [Pseudomonadales bacterium]